MRNRILIIIVCSMLSLTWCLEADGHGKMKSSPKEWQGSKYEAVLKSIADEDFDNAFLQFTELAAQGDSKSLCVLATMYCFPSGTTRDYAKAYSLLKQATLQDNERAEYLLGAFGSLYKSKQTFELFGVPAPQSADDGFWKQCFKGAKDVLSFKDAFEWFYMKDGNWGYRDIMYYAAVEFLDESSEVYNVEKGMKWLKKSADLKYGDAIKLLQRLAISKKAR